MVQLMKSGDFGPETHAIPCTEKVPVKLEVEESLEEEHGPLNKRSKPSPAFQERSIGDNVFAVPPSQFNPLDEPSPLGLRLRKSPSLLELIQMKLAQGSAAAAGATQIENLNSGVKKECKVNAPLGTADKLKASNFPASLLSIGSWEYKSRYEGDLVAKCYFAKHKLVWEVLEVGLKSKIEIQWSDIMALKATCPDDGPGTLTVVLARQPLFFRETNPQPRKHTLWQATADFTDGQASTYREHVLQCPQGLLNKHFEKLIQCDTRLCFLSRQLEIVMESPYFEPCSSAFEDPGESKSHGFDQLGNGPNGKGSSVAGFQDIASPSASQSSSLKVDQQDTASITFEYQSREAPSPSSVMDAQAIEGNGSSEAVDSRGGRNWEQIKVPGLQPSMSMSDIMSHIGNCISEQMTSGNLPSADQQSEYQDMLEGIAQYLLSDTQFTTASDEKSLMSRVNSLCCLLQKDPAAAQTQVDGDSHVEGSGNGSDVRPIYTPDNKSGADVKDSEEGVSDGKKASGMSRKDSFAELLFHLPRIASLPSLPKVLFNISEEDCESQAR
ncbi:uncharacterized protein LOC103929234 isoform X2 [Pyrus x bretschneideri]|uniref:uncharacterized protein LOC103929234 isoform X2 n=1 Tax=Pyrus x bretschneideri TaxID=225117 RepID=UPI00202EDD72|nr:uncharacterized protein LOC103929234 isoform X2 [Pyrus x bretschneideri]